ncbi:FtsX-like permease family protein [Patescibacteria group bacterium]|nr:FtsX-like permease family protein [Patescibacteria group bacterium]
MMQKIKNILKRPFYVILIIAAVLALWGIFAYWRGSQKATYELVEVARGEIIQQVSVILNLLLGFLAAISLLVGGIGIMNIMLVSVSERTQEIGLRKSLGATAKNILWQFLIESLVITGLGGVIGIIFGIIVSTLIGLIVRTQGLPDWPLTISWLAVFGAFFLAGLIGLIFGVYPARQAAKKSPMEALRYE